jgi:hypothetical protein
MSTYRLLADHEFGLAGTIVSTGDVGGIVPIGWVPDGQVDPLDPDAVEAFFAVGPQPMGPIGSRWVAQSVPPPVTYWVLVDRATFTYALTGLGANRGTAQIGSSPGSAGRPFGSIGWP